MILLNEFSEGVVTRNADESILWGEKLGFHLNFGTTIALYGDLGTGKTTFAKGLAAGLGIKETVKSPTYGIYTIYKSGNMPFVHVDAYRLENPDHFEDLLIDEIVADPKILCIEWPEKIGDNLPLNAIKLSFSIKKDGSHLIKMI